MGGFGSGRQGGRPTIEGCNSRRLTMKELMPLLGSLGTARRRWRMIFMRTATGERVR